MIICIEKPKPHYTYWHISSRWRMHCIQAPDNHVLWEIGLDYVDALRSIIKVRVMPFDIAVPEKLANANRIDMWTMSVKEKDTVKGNSRSNPSPLSRNPSAEFTRSISSHFLPDQNGILSSSWTSSPVSEKKFLDGEQRWWWRWTYQHRLLEFRRFHQCSTLTSIRSDMNLKCVYS